MSLNFNVHSVKRVIFGKIFNKKYFVKSFKNLINNVQYIKIMKINVINVNQDINLIHLKKYVKKVLAINIIL